MSAVLTLPRLGETMEEGQIVAWLVAPGVAYRRGDPILEVETDKTVVEVPALEDGELAEVLAAEGARVKVGDPLARLKGGAAVERAAAPSAGASPDPQPVAPRPQAMPAFAGVRATPVARKLARQSGMEIADISGTGRRNRVERSDVAARLGTAGDAGGWHYALTGSASGPPVVLLHGFAGDHTLWSGIAAGLARAGRHVLAPDLPGHGATAAESVTSGDLSTGLDALITDTLAGPAHIVAHSLGAVPAVALAEAGQARSLTLVAPAGLGLHIDGATLRGLATATTPGETAHLLERMTEAPLALSQDALEQITAQLRKGRLHALAKTLIGPAGQTVSLRAQLARLAERLPVRIIAAHRDRILDWQDMVTVSPRIAVHHLPRAGHMPQWDAQPDVLEILRAATGD